MGEAGGERGTRAERELANIYLARTRDEVRQLTEAGFLLAGHAFAPVLLVKGEPGPAELSGKGLLSGPDGAALQAALGRLGYPDDGWAACMSALPADGAWKAAAPEDLAWAVEVFDPELVVALDEAAAQALGGTWGLGAPLEAGPVARVRGRRVLALGGFEASLANPQAKQLMWARLKQVPPLGSPL